MFITKPVLMQLPNRLSHKKPIGRDSNPNSLTYDRSSWSTLRYFNFKPSFKLRWRRARNLVTALYGIVSQFKSSCGHWNLRYVIILRHDTIVNLVLLFRYEITIRQEDQWSHLAVKGTLMQTWKPPYRLVFI